ncbi:MAG: ABC transporter ATP-binding protein [Eubacteriales bacterium]|nr:ABC transporter ATP-binding protein [Eubacteriales bacterium]
MFAISASDLSFQYGEQMTTPLFKSVSFQLEPGKIAVITGASGCGKTTFAYCLAGLIPEHIAGIFQGEVKCSGRCGMVFQDPDTQIFMPRVQDELAFAPENLGLAREEIEERITEVLAETGLKDWRNANPAKLSGGQKQLVALGGVLTLCPAILILDEALSQVDRVYRKTLKELLCRLRDQGMAIVMIEHEAENMDIADELFLMEEGTLRPLEIAKSLPVQEQTPQEKARRSSLSSAKREVLRVEELRFFYENKKLRKQGAELPLNESLFDDLFFSLNSGEITALTGANGAGKSTLGKLLAGILAPKKGRVLLEGNDAAGLSLAQRGRQVGYCFQNPATQLFTQSVEEEIAFGLKYSKTEKESQAAITGKMLSLFELQEIRGSFPLNISWGEKRRLVIAAALALDPAYLILDEPTTGLDPKRIETLGTLLEELREQGTGILLISHNREFVNGIADRILVLEGGRIRDEGLSIA